MRFVLLAGRRLAGSVAFVLAVGLTALCIVRWVPGDPAAELALQGADARQLEAERTRLGADRSTWLHVQTWMKGLARLDLGTSTRFRRPVAGLVAERLTYTAGLALLALVVAFFVGLPLGILTGSEPGAWWSVAIGWVSVACVSCPPVIAVLGLLFLAVVTGWLSIAPGAIVVPLVALALPLAAAIERLQSQAMVDALSRPEMVAGAARGLPHARIVWRHAARQALAPVLGVSGVMVSSLFSGSLAVETVTAWPGIGRLLYEALVGRDLFLVAGCALAGAAIVAVANLAADLARAALDPRLQSHGA
jgi:peptide/nickel transport system permease protein